MTDQETRGLSTADLANAAERPRTPEPAGEVSDVDTGAIGGAESAGAGEHRARTANADRARTDTARPLFEGGDVDRFRGRWQEVQTGFVDDPRRAVRDADELVATVIRSLAETFAEHKGELEAQWRDGEPATEDLRIALRRYRSFFDQLLGA
ncbi:hypothetical protein VSH64_19820 [Amycolatopsis rhabdoformis]|uniref:Uncharacterized protein n=1 Tax=Amycolatopsis rhabdoformis TaxID=1448059 RepID=A0ABZ1ILE3_9PSEU|nr:hypothetical protein [Amycolatopsis rhabdoformis]WSE34315.1 hypothetical protein VSH64_19820 [Amycolatopsis rhabdoformis]